MLDRRLLPAALLIALCLSACSTTAIESTPAQGKTPAIVALFSPTSVTEQVSGPKPILHVAAINAHLVLGVALHSC